MVKAWFKRHPSATCLRPGDCGTERRAAQDRDRNIRHPSFHCAQFDLDLLPKDASPTAIAEAVGASRQVVYRVQDDPAKAGALLAEWGCR